MKRHPEGQAILRDRPIVDKDHIPYEHLIEQGKTTLILDTTSSSSITFGQAYGRFLLSHGFDPDERKPIQHIDDPDLSYVMLRYRQIHDYLHTLTGLPPTVLGELGLKWLELFQTGMPVAALSCSVGSLGLSTRERHILWKVYLPWAIRVHQQQQAEDVQGSLMTVYYEQEFDTPLEELRDRLKLEPAPDVGEDGY
jgi:ubiquinone biosynthesis protein COQ4